MVPMWDDSMTGGDFTHCATVAALNLFGMTEITPIEQQLPHFPIVPYPWQLLSKEFVI